MDGQIASLLKFYGSVFKVSSMVLPGLFSPHQSACLITKGKNPCDLRQEMQGSNSGICWGDFKLQVCPSGQKWSGTLSSNLDLLQVFNVMFHQ